MPCRAAVDERRNSARVKCRLILRPSGTILEVLSDMIWLFILAGVLLPHWGLPPRVNQVIAITIMVVALVLFVAWPDVRVNVD